jgi:hypothetical protein
VRRLEPLRRSMRQGKMKLRDARAAASSILLKPEPRGLPLPPGLRGCCAFPTRSSVSRPVSRPHPRTSVFVAGPPTNGTKIGERRLEKPRPRYFPRRQYQRASPRSHSLLSSLPAPLSPYSPSSLAPANSAPDEEFRERTAPRH